MNDKRKWMAGLAVAVVLSLATGACGQRVPGTVRPSGTKVPRAMEDFRDPKGNFTMKVPKGWVVSSGGFDLLLWIHAYDPAKPETGVFTLLKTECLLMNGASKAFYQDKRGFGLYAMFADMIVAEKVEDFYAQLPAFCAFAMKWEASYKGFVFPMIANFELLEKSPAKSPMAAVALDDAVLHATFTDPVAKRRGEGIFTGTLCRGIVMGNIGCNMMYNISGATAPEGEFGDWAETLAAVLGSVRYTEAFVQTVQTDLQIKAQGAARLNQTLRETSDLVVRGWEERQKGFDARVGKRADATLGYERVVDTESGDVYRAYNGFMDNPDASRRFRPASDEMYSLPLAGTIEK